MQRGIKPQTTASRIATGQAKKNPQRVNQHEPKAPEGAPLKPLHLDSHASLAWDHVVSIFDEMGMLSRADGTLIELYAVTYSGYRQALESVVKTGQVLVLRRDDTNGTGAVEVRRNPYSVELHKYMDRLGKLLGEMGLTPSSRSRVAVVKKEDDDPFMEWLKAKRSLN